MGAGVIGLISFGGVLATEVVVVTCLEGRKMGECCPCKADKST